MKNFTLLITILFFALTVTGQKAENLQLKIEKLQGKFATVLEHSKIFQTNPEQTHFYARLKSAAANEKLDSTVTRMLDLDSEIWENDWKEEFVYDEQMRNTWWKDFDWNHDDDNWEQNGATELEYNSQGYISSMTFSEINEISGEMMPESRLEAIYNEDGKITLLNFFSDENEVWVHGGEQKYHYNASGILIQVDMTSFDGEDESIMKLIFTYNAAGKLESQSMYFVDDEDEILFSKTIHSYDGNGRRIESEDWGISFTTFLLERNNRTIYQYNANGDVSVEIYSEWDGSAWKDTDKDEYIYSNTNFSEVAFPS
ncbi:MAG TPA: hypothetical protein ENN90_13505, partial [Mariniphaga anaerophila]|nr:hypothetical protein [Mariniphaga anaerophila]